MNRSFSFQAVPSQSSSLKDFKGIISPLLLSKSLPNIIELDDSHNENNNLSTKKNVSGIKRSNSKRVKILQKTWDKVKTIIHPSSSGRRGSKSKPQQQSSFSAVEPEISSSSSPTKRTASPSSKPSSKTNQTTTVPNSSSSVPSTPNKKLIFDFNFMNTTATSNNVTANNNGAPNSSSLGSSASATTMSQQQHENSSYNSSYNDQHYYYNRNNNSSNRTHKTTRNDEEDDQVIKHYVELQKRLSDELHQAILSKDAHGSKKDESLSEEFKKRLQQWDMWKASTGKYHYTEEELRQLIPSDFSKKLQEWEYIKTRPRGVAGGEEFNAAAGENSGIPSTNSTSAHQGIYGHSYTPSETSSSCSNTKKIQRKKKNAEVNRQKELAWLEKQLEKIECEKKRLEREMKKYCEREQRLQKMKEALKNAPLSKQVWIKTPTAECKVEGINEEFYKKLYKWEEKQGIQPESSTMALLNPKYYNTSVSHDEEHEQNHQEQDHNHQGHEMPNAGIELNLPDCTSPEDHDGVNPNPSRKTLSELLSSKRDYTSSDESEVDEEYEEATDSFATKDESRASGASNTDSECFNLKPTSGYRRRSSDAISTPLSLSGCTSDDEENYMLKTVNENEEDKVILSPIEERPLILKAKPILIEDDDSDDNGNNAGKIQQYPYVEQISNVIVPTKRMLFTPVETEPNMNSSYRQVEETMDPRNKLVKTDNLTSPNLIKHIADKISFPSSSTSSYTVTPRIVNQMWKKDDATPKIVGVVRKCSDASTISAISCTSSGRQLNHGIENQMPSASPPISSQLPPPLPMPPSYMGEKLSSSPPRLNFSKISSGNKIPVWCSPLITRRRFCFDQQQHRQQQPTAAGKENKFSPSTDFSIDKFLEVSNLYLPSNSTSSSTASTAGCSANESPQQSFSPHNLPTPIRPSRIPITSPGFPRRKYTFDGEFYSPNSEHDENNGNVKLVSITRSSSFQGTTKRQQERQQQYNLQLQQSLRQQQQQCHVPIAAAVGNSNELSFNPNTVKPEPLSLITTSEQHVVSSKPPIPNISSKISSTNDPSKVTKSKSTGSILGGSSSSSSKGLFGFASKFGLASHSGGSGGNYASDVNNTGNGNTNVANTPSSKVTEQKSKTILPGWLRHTNSSSHAAKK